MTVFVYIIDKCLSIVIMNGALIILFDFIIRFTIKTDFPGFLCYRGRDRVDFVKNMSCFKTVLILLSIWIARHNLFSIFAVNPTLDEIYPIPTSAEFDRLAHRNAQRSDLFHHVKFGLFCVMLCDVGYTVKITCAVLIGNTVFFII